MVQRLHDRNGDDAERPARNPTKIKTGVRAGTAWYGWLDKLNANPFERRPERPSTEDSNDDAIPATAEHEGEPKGKWRPKTKVRAGWWDYLEQFNGNPFVVARRPPARERSTKSSPVTDEAEPSAKPIRIRTNLRAGGLMELLDYLENLNSSPFPEEERPRARRTRRVRQAQAMLRKLRG
jgi:hypothetical protein